MANHKDFYNSVDQEELLNELPSSLRAEVIMHTHGEIIRRIKFFEDKNSNFLWKILPMLKPMRMFPEDVIYNQGDKSEEIFFILRGRVKIMLNLNTDLDGEPYLVAYN